MKVLWVARAAIALLLHPALWTTAVRQVLVLAIDGWWKRAPFLPVPDRAYLRFRMQTMYGDPDAVAEPGDVLTYLHWCKAWPSVTSHA